MDNNILFTKKDNPNMFVAFEHAQATFKYFWRELWWEHRRLIKALDIALAKLAFTQQTSENEPPIVEHMWVNEVWFDGENIQGVLANEPQQVSNVKVGERVTKPLSEVSDWLFSIAGKTYGGFTIHVLRTQMPEAERKAHDEAWGLDFGDSNNILIAYEQLEHPEYLTEHPMSSAMREKVEEFVKEYPNDIDNKDNDGYAMLHREAIAGSKTPIEVLLAAGADVHLRTDAGETALDLAKKVGWTHLIPLLEIATASNC